MLSEPTPAPAVGMIWAEARGGVIGAGGGMPWHVPEDLAHFRKTTRGCPVIMGRKTWESLPERFRPLPGRTNIVITGDAARAGEFAAEGAATASSLEAAVELAQTTAADADQVWVMGGGTIYAEAVEKGLAQQAEVTRLDIDTDGDTCAPALDPAQWELVSAEPESGWKTSESGIRYRFETYRRQ